MQKNSESVDNNPKKDHNCRKCELKFPTKSKLRLHIKTSHHQVIKYNYCDNIFSQHFELEKHLENHMKKGFT